MRCDDRVVQVIYRGRMDVIRLQSFFQIYSLKQRGNKKEREGIIEGKKKRRKSRRNIKDCNKEDERGRMVRMFGTWRRQGRHE